jgi:hypothetical protein
MFFFGSTTTFQEVGEVLRELAVELAHVKRERHTLALAMLALRRLSSVFTPISE